MFRLICFEIRKNYMRTHIVIFILLFFALNSVYIYKDSISSDGLAEYFLPKTSQNQAQWDAYNKLHRRLDGDITEDKVKFVIGEFNRLNKLVSGGTYSQNYQSNTYTGYVFGDFFLIKKYFYNSMEELVFYKKNNIELLKKASDNIKFYKKYKNNFEVKRNQFIKNNYSKREITQFYETKSWEKLFDYYFSDLLLLLILILTTVPTYVNEKKTKMDELILSAQNGELNLLLAKVISGLLFVFSLEIIFSVANLLQFKLYYGLSGFSMPLYALEAYKNTPLNLAVFNFYLVLNVLKVLGLFIFFLWILLFSACSKRVVVPFIISSITTACGLFLSGFSDSISMLKSITALANPFTLLRGQKLFQELLGFDIFDSFYLKSTICIILNFFVGITLLLLVMRLGRSKERKVLNFCLFGRLKKICLNRRV